jgi:hypothetical protein
MVIIKKNRDIAFSLSFKVSFCYRYSTLYVGRIPKHPIPPLPAKPVLQTTCQWIKLSLTRKDYVKNTRNGER